MGTITGLTKKELDYVKANGISGLDAISKSRTNGDDDIDDDIDSDIDTRTYASMGHPYRIGDLEVPPIPPARVMYLQDIDSPFVTAAEGDDVQIGTDGLLQTLYVLVKGRDAMRPLLAMKQRKKQAEKIENLASKNAEYYEIYIRSTDPVTKAWEEFEFNAREFWETIGGVNFQDAVETVTLMIADAFESFSALPDEDDSDGNNGEKKTS